MRTSRNGFYEPLNVLRLFSLADLKRILYYKYVKLIFRVLTFNEMPSVRTLLRARFPFHKCVSSNISGNAALLYHTNNVDG